jgi:hypothetical protein
MELGDMGTVLEYPGGSPYNKNKRETHEVIASP